MLQKKRKKPCYNRVTVHKTTLESRVRIEIQVNYLCFAVMSLTARLTSVNTRGAALDKVQERACPMRQLYTYLGIVKWTTTRQLNGYLFVLTCSQNPPSSSQTSATSSITYSKSCLITLFVLWGWSQSSFSCKVLSFNLHKVAISTVPHNPLNSTINSILTFLFRQPLF